VLFVFCSFDQDIAVIYANGAMYPSHEASPSLHFGDPVHTIAKASVFLPQLQQCSHCSTTEAVCDQVLQTEGLNHIFKSIFVYFTITIVSRLHVCPTAGKRPPSYLATHSVKRLEVIPLARNSRMGKVTARDPTCTGETAVRVFWKILCTSCVLNVWPAALVVSTPTA